LATRQKPVTTDNEDAAETNGVAGKSRTKAPAAKNTVKPAPKTAARPRVRAKAAVAEQAPPAEETTTDTNGAAVATSPGAPEANGAAPSDAAGNGVETVDVTAPYASAVAVAAIAANPATDEPNPEDIKATERGEWRLAAVTCSSAGSEGSGHGREGWSLSTVLGAVQRGLRQESAWSTAAHCRQLSECLVPVWSLDRRRCGELAGLTVVLTPDVTITPTDDPPLMTCPIP